MDFLSLFSTMSHIMPKKKNQISWFSCISLNRNTIGTYCRRPTTASTTPSYPFQQLLLSWLKLFDQFSKLQWTTCRKWHSILALAKKSNVQKNNIYTILLVICHLRKQVAMRNDIKLAAQPINLSVTYYNVIGKNDKK